MMTQYDPNFYQDMIDRHCHQFARAKITADEFAAAVLQKLSDAPLSYLPGLAAALVAAVPAPARPALVRVVRDTLRSDFHHGAWKYGGPDSRTDAELAEEAARITAGFRAVAAVLAHELADEPTPAP